MLKIREEALDWWDEAKNNLRQAKKNFEINEWSVSAFLAHQVGEKALKALYIIKKRRLPPRGHDLVKLGKLVSADEIMNELKLLNPHYIVSRYPNAANGIPSEVYTKEISERCIKAAELVINWVKKSSPLN